MDNANRERVKWFRDTGFGVFANWHAYSVNPDGSALPYYGAVTAFDVNRLAEQLYRAGAGFVIFSVTWYSHQLAFPCEAMDAVTSGNTISGRDIYADMYDALKEKGIKMMFYRNSAAYPEADDNGYYENGGWAGDPALYARNQYRIVEEIGNRYGDRLAGWWIDTCYDDHPGIEGIGQSGWGSKFDFGVFADKLRAGNPDRIVSFNFRWQYWGSETGKGIADYQAGKTAWSLIPCPMGRSRARGIPSGSPSTPATPRTGCTRRRGR